MNQIPGLTTILLVDDHPLFHEGLASALARLAPELTIVGAETGAAGLRALDGERPIDLALIDLLLPDVDGLTVLKTYAGAHPAIPRVLISGRVDEDTIRAARRAGASGFLSKALPVGRIIEALRSVLAGDEWFHTSPSSPADANNKREAPVHGQLTLRQIEVLGLLGEGRTNKEIASALNIAERTARAHLTELFQALGVSSRTQAVIAAQRAGLLAAHPRSR